MEKGVLRGELTELSRPRARSIKKNRTAQNVDPDRVEMASGYRTNTRPAPVRNIRAWSVMDVQLGLHRAGEPQAASGPLVRHVWAADSGTGHRRWSHSIVVLLLRSVMSPKRPCVEALIPSWCSFQVVGTSRQCSLPFIEKTPL